MSDAIDDILILIAIWSIPFAIIYGGKSGMSEELIIGLIGAGVTILIFVLKWIFYDRRQYKQILKSLGKFEMKSLENSIGVLGKDDLSVSGQIQDTKNSVLGEIGIGKDDKSLTGQHDEIKTYLKDEIKTYLKDEIKTKVDYIEREIYIEKESRILLNPNQKDVHDTVKLFLFELTNVNKENHRLISELNKQKLTISKLLDENRKLVADISQLQSKAKNAEFKHELGKNIKPILPLKGKKGPTL